MKRFIICFIGVDGSGKTTLCKLLIDELRDRRIPSRYVYGRFIPKITIPIFSIISLLKINNNNSNIKKEAKELKNIYQRQRRILRNSVISYFYITGVFIEQILQIFFKVSLPSLFKKEVIVCDRWFFDTALLDIAIPCGYDNKRTIQFVKRFIRLFPKVHLIFLVTVPPKIARIRKNDAWQIKELEQLSKSYLLLGKTIGAINIDGTKDLSELRPLLINILKASGIIPENLQKCE